MANGNGRKIRVAFLEDCLFIRDAVGQLLEQHGVEIVGNHESAPAFFETLRTARPDVAVLDLFLLPGPQRLLEQIRDVQPRPKLMVFASRSDDDLLERARDAGIDAYLEKRSTDVRTLIAAVHGLADGQRPPYEPGPASAPQGTAVPTSEDAQRLAPSLSDREREVLGCIAAGWDNMKIAAVLGITERTVRAHVSALYRKLDCENRAAMALLGYRMGLGRS